MFGLPLAWGLLKRFWPLAVIAAVIVSVLLAIRWHEGRKDELSRHFFKAGQTAERVVWEEARRRAELARMAERRAAQIEIARREAELLAAETQAADETRILADELERALSAIPPDQAPCRLGADSAVPDSVLDPLRRLGP